ncbi:ATP-dependent Clp protease adaptor ClpS [Myroides pelagicus]|uniref:ATP-dependent Clp protease adaptor ClpS n=1 Tax=Myroides pelagicus TaxID=270914 RepID=A0A7K1GKF7_9FLAO|nr:ATP-dependent Clp protease adaptor ClpS [Myroides pelagicus]MEC4114291.1 ATP-dependent Clp protease adaptor ClpS [Myroides pelagicus]MTH29341.1 ATP-dependent Clp protease adaptor ClpS [Myroides pelagicus]
MSTKEQILEKVDIAELLNGTSELVLHNDDVNTFDYVIETLIRVCNHTSLQAEQCAMLVHYKGKCTVKSGEFEKLKNQCLQLLDAGLSAEIV